MRRVFLRLSEEILADLEAASRERRDESRRLERRCFLVDRTEISFLASFAKINFSATAASHAAETCRIGIISFSRSMPVRHHLSLSRPFHRARFSIQSRNRNFVVAARKGRATSISLSRRDNAIVLSIPRLYLDGAARVLFFGSVPL